MKISLRSSAQINFRHKLYSDEALIRVMREQGYKNKSEALRAGERLLPNFTKYEQEAKEAYANSINQGKPKIDIFITKRRK